MGLFRKLALVFTIVPLIEFFLFWKIGNLIGIWITVATIVVTGIAGAWLTKVQGLKTLSQYHKALGEGRLPHREVMDGILILLAGAVLLTPGFLTDAAGFLLLLPPFRNAVRTFLGKRLRSKMQTVGQDLKTRSQKTVPEESDVIPVEAEILEETEKENSLE